MYNPSIRFTGYIKNKVKRFSLFFLILTSMCLTACDVLAQPKDSQVEKPFSIMHIQESHDDYTLDVSYPITQQANIDAALSEFMTSRLIRFKDDLLQTTQEEAKEGDSQYVLHARIAFASDDILSFRISESARVGQRESLELVHTFNFNRHTQEEIALDNVFPHQDAYLNILSELSYKKILEDSRFKSASTQQIKDGTLPFIQNFSSYLYGEHGITLIFNSGQVAPDALGIIAILLPFRTLQEQLEVNYDAFRDGYTSLYPIFPVTSGNIANEESAYFTKTPLVQETTTSEILKPIALTFDDGPHPQYTEQVLKILENHKAKATFFMIGKRVRAFPTIAKAVSTSGHSIGNHTWSHPQMTKLDSIKVMEQIDMTQRIVERITGVRPATVRVPFGHFTEEMHKWINMPLIQWSVDPQDWKTKDPKVIANRVIANAKPGSVVLLHDIHNATVQALPMILEHLAAKGYTFVTVDELFELDKREVYYKITMDKE